MIFEERQFGENQTVANDEAAVQFRRLKNNIFHILGVYVSVRVSSTCR